jgi:hypothetical protein
MKKFLTYGGLALLIVALVGYFTMQYFLGGIVKAGVNKFGPGITQTKVELQGANISPLSGAGTLSGFTVGNPTGWSNANAFHLGKVQISMEPFSVFKDHIVINELIIEQPEFLYETKLVSSNIGDLLKNIEQSVGAKDREPKSKTGQPIKMVVKKLILRDGKVTVAVAGNSVVVPMPAVELTDIGVAEGGVAPVQVAVAVMASVTKTVVAAATQVVAKQGTAGAIDAAKQAAGNVLQGFLGGKKQEPAKEPAKK